MDFTAIRYEVADGVATITLNRPEKLNAYTRDMGREIMAAFDEIDKDDAVRAVIVTGEGRAFCAGADLSGGAKTFDYAARGTLAGADLSDDSARDSGGRLTLRIFECLKPVIAAVNGPAVGIGATMLLPMDIRLASETARFGFVFARRGVVMEACSSWFLPRIAGISQALEWTMTGRVFDAAEARDGRLVKKVLPPDQLLPAARTLAREIAENTSGISVALMRQLQWRMLGADHPMEAHKLESRFMVQTGAGADAREGIAAFLEKRPAKFAARVSADMPGTFPWWKARKYD